MDDNQIIKSERLNALKNRVKKECERRKYPYGNFNVGSSDKGKPVDRYGEDSWDFNPEPSTEMDILSDQYEKISIPLRKINHAGPEIHVSSATKVPNGPTNRVITDEDLTLFEVNLTALESRAIDVKTSTDCSVSCTGTCTTVCTGTCSGSATGSGGDTCSSCASSCSGICGNSCSNSCASSCGNAGCSGYCGAGCIGNCVVSCYSAASRADQTRAAAKYGVSISPTTCLDSCVGNCTKGCGNSCGSSCGNECATYTVSVAKPPFLGSMYTVHLPPSAESFSTNTFRYWYFNIILPGTNLVPLSKSYPNNDFCKDYYPKNSDHYVSGSPSAQSYFDGKEQMNNYGPISEATINEAMSQGYFYRIPRGQGDIRYRNKVEHYIGKNGNNAIVETIYRVDILHTNYFLQYREVK